MASPFSGWAAVSTIVDLPADSGPERSETARRPMATCGRTTSGRSRPPTGLMGTPYARGAVAAHRDAGGEAAGDDSGTGRDRDRDDRGAAAAAEVVYRPLPLPRHRPELGVGVDRVRVPDQAEHRHVVQRVAVRAALGQVEALPLGEREYRGRLGLAVQQPADQPARVPAVGCLG